MIESVRKTWKEALDWLGWNSIGGLFPIIAGFILFLFFKKKPSFSDFSNNGQFAILSATMLASSFYIIFKEYKASFFSGRKIYGAICLILLIFVVLLFSSVTAAEAGKFDHDLDRNLVRQISLIIYVISVIITFFLTALDKDRSYTDLLEDRKRGIKKLDGELDSLGQDNG